MDQLDSTGAGATDMAFYRSSTTIQDDTISSNTLSPVSAHMKPKIIHRRCKCTGCEADFIESPSNERTLFCPYQKQNQLRVKAEDLIRRYENRPQDLGQNDLDFLRAGLKKWTLLKGINATHPDRKRLPTLLNEMNVRRNQLVKLVDPSHRYQKTRTRREDSSTNLTKLKTTRADGPVALVHLELPIRKKSSLKSKDKPHFVNKPNPVQEDHQVSELLEQLHLSAVNVSTVSSSCRPSVPIPTNTYVSWVRMYKQRRHYNKNSEPPVKRLSKHQRDFYSRVCKRTPKYNQVVNMRRCFQRSKKHEIQMLRAAFYRKLLRYKRRIKELTSNLESLIAKQVSSNSESTVKQKQIGALEIELLGLRSQMQLFQEKETRLSNDKINLEKQLAKKTRRLNIEKRNKELSSKYKSTNIISFGDNDAVPVGLDSSILVNDVSLASSTAHIEESEAFIDDQLIEVANQSPLSINQIHDENVPCRIQRLEEPKPNFDIYNRLHTFEVNPNLSNRSYSRKKPEIINFHPRFGKRLDLGGVPFTRCLIVDGANVARIKAVSAPKQIDADSNMRMKVARLPNIDANVLSAVAHFWRAQGIDVQIYLRELYFNRTFEYKVTNQSLLTAMRKIFTFPIVRDFDDDDAMLIQHAMETNGVILSNDGFQEFYALDDFVLAYLVKNQIHVKPYMDKYIYCSRDGSAKPYCKLITDVGTIQELLATQEKMGSRRYAKEIEFLRQQRNSGPLLPDQYERLQILLRKQTSDLRHPREKSSSCGRVSPSILS